MVGLTVPIGPTETGCSQYWAIRKARRRSPHSLGVMFGKCRILTDQTYIAFYTRRSINCLFHAAMCQKNCWCYPLFCRLFYYILAVTGCNGGRNEDEVNCTRHGNRSRQLEAPVHDSTALLTVDRNMSWLPSSGWRNICLMVRLWTRAETSILDDGLTYFP